MKKYNNYKPGKPLALWQRLTTKGLLTLCAVVCCGITLLAQPKVNKLEYYIDTDPGYGKGKPVTVTPATNISNVGFNVDISALAQGVHILGVRSGDDANAWSLDQKWLFLKAYSVPGAVATPKITKVEYYIDTDPGYGKATAITVAKATNVIVAGSFSMAPLAQGVHIIGIRSQDSLGAWSLDQEYLFLKAYTPAKLGATPKITRLEYYMDSDPGYGKATPVAITSATNINTSSIVPLSSLTQGVHIMGLRSQDSLGAWSLDQRFIFLKPYTALKLGVLPKITRVEYYFDKDPGYGKATPISFTKSTNLNLTSALSIAAVSEGVHIVAIRSQDSLGAWSIDQKLMFLKAYTFTKLGATPKIKRIEYFFDNDPGYGKATAIPVTPATTINATADLTTPYAVLGNGVHILDVRSQDSLGAWSLDQKWLFLKNYFFMAPLSVPKMRLVEYYIDNDPGRGKATPVTISHGTDVSAGFSVNISSLANGNHFIGIRSLDSVKGWSLDNKYAFTTNKSGLMKQMSFTVTDSATAVPVSSAKLQSNPVHSSAVLLYTAAKDERISIKVVDNAGNTVTTKQANVYTGLNRITLETATLAQGIYMVHTNGAKDAFTIKMLKQ